jgi:hypothetical protein
MDPANGDIVIVGDFDQTVDFDPSSDDSELTPIAFDDIFVARLSSAGDLKWIVGVGSAFISDMGNAVAVGSDGSVYLTGLTNDGFELPASMDSFIVQTSGSQGFVLKLDSDGEYAWSHAVGDVGDAIAVNSGGDVLIAGRFDDVGIIGGIRRFRPRRGHHIPDQHG